ncbi:hypothetical protein Gotur_030363 [Gossypium turneri]
MWGLAPINFCGYVEIANSTENQNFLLAPRAQHPSYETLLHVMKNCPKAWAVLVYGGFNNNLIEGSYYRCVDWIEDMARTLDKKAFSDFITVLWNI